MGVVIVSDSDAAASGDGNACVDVGEGTTLTGTIAVGDSEASPVQACKVDLQMPRASWHAVHDMPALRML